ncbi:uncharacterized protein LOC101898013 [Musca domestica]|uniref:Uncharacterized protein LOC101898013 n=1 Tax=Musca domestica TaxID=7370 RepID=A0A1I8MU85_MUSDO|nr:uncharacterized protein LOC101898013 [Musca domestica]
MKFLSLFFIFGLLAVIASMGSMVAGEPLPSPRGRPATTTKRPKADSDGEAGAGDRR